MAFLGPAEIVLIVVVIAIFFFGKDKVLDWARTAGQAKKEFSAGTKEETKKKQRRSSLFIGFVWEVYPDLTLN